MELLDVLSCAFRTEIWKLLTEICNVKIDFVTEILDNMKWY